MSGKRVHVKAHTRKAPKKKAKAKPKKGRKGRGQLSLL